MNKKTVLIVDDEEANRLLLEDALYEDYEIADFPSGEELFKHLDAGNPADLVVLDIVMPELDGFEVCKRLKANGKTSDIPVLFLTALNREEDEEHGLAIGAEDFVHKPFSIPIVRARVETHLKLAEAREVLRDRNASLEREVAERTREVTRKSKELVRAQSATIKAFCTLAEQRDNETGNHIIRTQNYVRILAEELQDHPRFAHFYDDDTVSSLFKSAPLHDIGKVAIPDHILLKPGKLTDEEWVIMKEHTRYGYEAIIEAEHEFGDEAMTFLHYAKEIAYSHHEKWDGSGYPQGLSGDDIPFSARLMAVADVYDALRSERPYKKPFTHEKAVEIIAEGRNTHFDPDIADTMLALDCDFRTVSEQLKD